MRVHRHVFVCAQVRMYMCAFACEWMLAYACAVSALPFCGDGLRGPSRDLELTFGLHKGVLRGFLP